MKIAGTWPLKSFCSLLASSCNCGNTKKVWCIQFPVRLTYSLSVSGGGTLHRSGLTGVWGKCYMCKISHNSCRASRILAEEHKQEHHIELYMPMLTLFSLSFGVVVGWARCVYNNRHWHLWQINQTVLRVEKACIIIIGCCKGILGDSNTIFPYLR